MIEIEINGKTLQAEDGSMIIEVADQHGVHIPRFCYHKKLSIAANCRMCLVEVEKAPKPLPACATPITSGMKVFTQSDVALAAQKAVMEFLLINHPLDCPICDQGGQCELQDVAMGYGKGISRYTEGKRAVDDQNLGSLIATDMTRCIHCTRCVRFGEEIAGIRELGVTGRGEESRIGTYIQHAVRSEMSGNIIDVCPVGALTSKPFRFTARAWELNQTPSIAAHDCVGSNIFVHSLRGSVMRVIPKENEVINEMWLSDRDRFSYTALHSKQRLQKPIIKREGNWEECDWSEALHYVVEKLKKVIAHHNTGNIGGVISPNATLEEMYLFQKLLRGIGCNNIDHRLRHNDFSDQATLPLMPTCDISIAEIEKLQTILLVGSDVQREQPIMSHRIRKAVVSNHANVASVNPIDFQFNFDQSHKIICQPQLMTSQLAGILKVLLAATQTELHDKALAKLLANINPSDQQQAIASLLQRNDKAAIFMGAISLQHPDQAIIRALVKHIAALCDASVAELTEGANSAGAWLAGCVPHRTVAGAACGNAGLNCREIFDQQLKAYLLFNVEPELDAANPYVNTQALKKADFVVSFSAFKGGVLNAHADVILPIAPFTENTGTFINCEGKWQHFNANVGAFAEVRPAWKVLRVLGNLLGLNDFDYVSSEQIRDELREIVEQPAQLQATAVPAMTHLSHMPASKELQRITLWPMYLGDNVVRRSQPLQAAAANEMVAIYLNAKSAQQLDLMDHEQAIAIQNGINVELPLCIDERIPDGCVYIPAGSAKTAKLGHSFAAIEIKKIGE